MTLDKVADELYGADLADFVPARKSHEKQARSRGDRELAARIAGLEKPVVAAWLLNQLVRRQPGEVAALLDLGEGMRQAQAGLAADELRTLSAQRHKLVAALARQAVQLGREVGRAVGDDVVRQIEDTLSAALAAPDAGAQLQQGRLTRPMQVAGFAGPQPGRTADTPAAAKPGDVARDGRRREQARDALLAAEKSAARAAAEAEKALRRLSEAEAEVTQLRQALQEGERERNDARGAADALTRAAERAESEAAEARRRLAGLPAQPAGGAD